ncbi:hypothetical protein [Arcobacter sp. CECT 8985]|uniref:hypothetical protein n=1 Tax=Arcobacter sp. CECT 8985 TaxID=1935424 RepID=UPI00100B40A7|nr:hypothetical protein [Arcobacter sp. CECT 8985]RXJ87483.1 hypothetical protein CRU93_04010 [Arcobacter sp. CECT 8985]
MNYKIYERLKEESRDISLLMNSKEYLDLKKKFNLRYLEIKANIKLIKEIQTHSHYFISNSSLVAKQQKKSINVDEIDKSINKMNREINKFNKNNRYKNRYRERER